MFTFLTCVTVLIECMEVTAPWGSAITLLQLVRTQQTRFREEFLRHTTDLPSGAGGELPAQLRSPKRSRSHDEVTKSSSWSTGGILIWVVTGSKTVTQLVYECLLPI